MRIVKNAKYAVVCFFVIICEMLFGKYLQIGGVVPMLSFCLCLANTMLEDNPKYIVTTAIVLGVLLDAYSGRAFGTYTIVFFLASVASYIVRDSVFSSKILVLICDVFVMSLFSSLVFWIFNVWNLGGGFLWMLTDIALPQAGYNIVVSIIFYFILKKIFVKRR